MTNNLPFSSNDRTSGCGGSCPIEYTGGGYCVAGAGGFSPVPGAVGVPSRANECEITYLPNRVDFNGTSQECVDAELKP
jgi:hypothetical protein